MWILTLGRLFSFAIPQRQDCVRMRLMADGILTIVLCKCASHITVCLTCGSETGVFETVHVHSRSQSQLLQALCSSSSAPSHLAVIMSPTVVTLLSPCRLLFPVPSRSDEPRSHSPPERKTSESGGQLPACPPTQTRRCHHPVQPAQAVEHHGEAGTPD